MNEILHCSIETLEMNCNKMPVTGIWFYRLYYINCDLKDMFASYIHYIWKLNAEKKE